MNIGLRGHNLIFLISQPRAGSTLTQRILGNHSDIHTVSEPWLMLHPLYALSNEGYEAEYNAKWSLGAIKNFLEKLPDGEETYFEGIRRTYTYLYNSTLTVSGKQYFLDKTPRYYHIIPELYRTFPKAKYIILLRNPLAVLCSIISTWTKENWFRLYLYQHDLLKAPIELIEGIKLLTEKCTVLHYEKLLSNPENEIKIVCDQLEINYEAEIINYGLNNFPNWKFGDQKSVYTNKQPNSKNIDAWISHLENPQVWRVVNDYLHFLGEDIINQMGYSYEELEQIINENRPHWFKLWRTFSLKWLLKKPEERKKFNYEDYLIRLITSVQLRGFGGTLIRLVQKLFHKQANSVQVTKILSS